MDQNGLTCYHLRIARAVGWTPLPPPDSPTLPQGSDLGDSNPGCGSLCPLRPLPPGRPAGLERAGTGANAPAGPLPHHLSPALPHLPASSLTHCPAPRSLPRRWQGLRPAHRPHEGRPAALARLPRHQLDHAAAPLFPAQPPALQRPGHHLGAGPV